EPPKLTLTPVSVAPVKLMFSCSTVVQFANVVNDEITSFQPKGTRLSTENVVPLKHPLRLVVQVNVDPCHLISVKDCPITVVTLGVTPSASMRRAKFSSVRATSASGASTITPPVANATASLKVEKQLISFTSFTSFNGNCMTQ